MTEKEKELIVLASDLVNVQGGSIEINGKYLVRLNRETNRTEFVIL